MYVEYIKMYIDMHRMYKVKYPLYHQHKVCHKQVSLVDVYWLLTI